MDSSVGLFSALTLIIASLQISSACQCIEKCDSLEEEFCNCLVAFKGTIVGKEDVRVADVPMLKAEESSSYDLPDDVHILTPPPFAGDFEVHYLVKVKHIYKGKGGRLKRWKSIKLKTSKDPQNCGVPELIQHETYLFLLFSYPDYINFCDGFYVFKTIPSYVVDSMYPESPLCQHEYTSPVVSI